MDVEIWGLAGAVIGSGTTLLTTSLNERARSRAEDRQRREAEHREVRDLCATAYVEAVEASLTLNNTYVEDSVDPRWEDDMAPGVGAAVQQVRSARASLRKASALGTSEACNLAGETAVALGVLDRSWHDAQDARRKLVAARTASDKKLTGLYQRMFDESFASLLASRQLLTGFDGTEMVDEAVAQGGTKAASLLERLRSATAHQGQGTR
ncbi:hypothetical protein [Cellulosimicrobium protaetiae]